MSNTFIANTSTEGLAPLGSAPQRSFELISGTVLDELGERHAALFAEPEGTEFGDRFDWYANAAGKPRQLSSLDEDEQPAAQTALDKLIGDVNKLAERLLADEDPSKQRLGEALSNAVQYPGPETVYIFGSGKDAQPVLVNWAWVADTQVAVTGSLTDTGQSADTKAKVAAEKASMAAVAAPLPPPPLQRREGMNPLFWWLLWLGWLLLVLMIGVILYLMIEACALKVPGFPNHCPPPGPTVLDLERKAEVLRDQIAAAERKVGVADRACQPKQAALFAPDPRQRFAALMDETRVTHRPIHGAQSKPKILRPKGRS